jgi:hypothetical protein
MDTIDFNKHDINIFINLAKIVHYGRHWDESCNEWRLLLIIYFDGNFPYAKLRPYDDYKIMSTLNTYCGILSTCHNYKKIMDNMKQPAVILVLQYWYTILVIPVFSSIYNTGTDTGKY